jgi:hypothetical protein
MKIYLVSTAPGTEGTKGKGRKLMCWIPMRLLSYHHIVGKLLYSDRIFKEICRINHKAIRKIK